MSGIVVNSSDPSIQEADAGGFHEFNASLGYETIKKKKNIKIIFVYKSMMCISKNLLVFR